MPRGGKRPNSGRPLGRQNDETLLKAADTAKADKIIREVVLKHWEPIVAAQAQHAMGVSYMVLRAPDGSFARATDEKQIDAACASGATAFRIFTQAPNTQAFAALSDRAFDKPIERHQVTGAEGGPVIYKWQE